MKPREYCCCAIPVINAGIYFTLTEQFVLGIVVGILSVSTPSIVGAVTPSFAPWLLAVVCFVVSAVQILGFFGVAQEKSILFRRYVSLHTLAAVGAFSTLCNIFPFVDVGVMGGLWVILAGLHIYLYFVITSYSSAQQRDHDKYESLNYKGSAASMADVLAEPIQQPNDGFSMERQGSYPPPSRRQPSLPANAYTQDETPTPRVGQSYYSDDRTVGNIDKPVLSQAHPGE
ncbi:hypothetical protein B0H11DRAFT_2157101 [Mycena galericulata]|nr:hypothetical protein B0H11DRAFT_2157101 [Mycena galericulata]